MHLSSFSRNLEGLLVLFHLIFTSFSFAHWTDLYVPTKGSEDEFPLTFKQLSQLLCDWPKDRNIGGRKTQCFLSNNNNNNKEQQHNIKNTNNSPIIIMCWPQIMTWCQAKKKRKKVKDSSSESHPESWILNPESWILDLGSWMEEALGEGVPAQVVCRLPDQSYLTDVN